MAKYNISDCLTFGLVILFLTGALIAGPPRSPSITSFPETRYKDYEDRMQKNEGIIEQFTSYGKVIGGVHPDMIRLYNSS